MGKPLRTLTVDRYPQDYIAYIGSGQVVDLQRNEAISYQFVIGQARQRNDRIGIMDLTMIGPPPYDNVLKLAVRRSYLNKYGGVIYESREIRLPVRFITRAPEYTALYYAMGYNGHRMAWAQIAGKIILALMDEEKSVLTENDAINKFAPGVPSAALTYLAVNILRSYYKLLDKWLDV